jgi:hypothetical protein
MSPIYPLPTVADEGVLELGRADNNPGESYGYSGRKLLIQDGPTMQPRF